MTPRSISSHGAIRLDCCGLMPGRSGHSHSDFRCGVVPRSEISRPGRTVHFSVDRPPRRVIGNHDRRRRKFLHDCQRLDHAPHRVGTRIVWICISFIELRLQLIDAIYLVVGMRHNHAGMISSWGIQFKPKKLDDFGHNPPRLQNTWVSLLQIKLCVVSTSMIGGHHP